MHKGRIIISEKGEILKTESVIAGTLNNFFQIQQKPENSKLF